MSTSQIPMLALVGPLSSDKINRRGKPAYGELEGEAPVSETVETFEQVIQ